MARYPNAFEEKIKRAIRDALAHDPLLTQTGLIDRLNKLFERSFDHSYITRLTKKVVGQSRDEVHRATIEPCLASLRETHRIARERFSTITTPHHSMMETT